jgi:hypothetical protein
MKRRIFYTGIGLFLLPILAAGLFILTVRFQALFRYDQAYFTPQYQKLYDSPGPVAVAIEQALHRDDRSIFSELTGLRMKIRPPEGNPNIHLMIVLKVTDQGYFQYLFFDVKTYHRIVYNIKKVGGRWVMVPYDAYYFLDNGDWLLFFTPALLLYWSFLAVIGVGLGIYYLAARFREQLYGTSKH